MKKLLVLIILFAYTLPSYSQVVSGKAGKIWWSDDKLYVNVVEQGVLVIDNTNPQQPKKLGFIEIPGSIDIAVKGNMLFANNYEDLVAIDISNLSKVSEKRVMRFHDVFSQYDQGDDHGKITFIKPPKSRWMSTSTAMVSSSKGGSMACFTIAGDYLYTIDTEHIHTFNIKNEEKPEKEPQVVEVRGNNIETIFNHCGNLYIGAQKGMYIYGLNDPREPKFLGEYEHTQSCDPVVVEGRYAYLTLRDGTECNRKVNRLEIIDVQDPANPRRVSSTKMTHPHGLAVDKGMIFLCDGRAGFKVLDATNPKDVDMVKKYEYQSSTYDVINIPAKKLLIMVTDSHVTQYDYQSVTALKHLSDFKVDL